MNKPTKVAPWVGGHVANTFFFPASAANGKVHQDVMPTLKYVFFIVGYAEPVGLAGLLNPTS
jgi:hypothetical protein